MNLARSLQRWRDMPLVVQFVAAGAAVMLVAMLAIGSWITGRIEESVVANSASSGALYLEAFVSPLSQELAANDRLSTTAVRALEEVFEAASLSDRIVSFKIWKPGGLIAHASDPSLIGQRFPPTTELQAAWSGVVTGTFEGLDDEESAGEAALGLPLLEVYTPIHEVWSGRVIAVAEFYEIADELEEDLADARRKSWLLVAGTFLASGLMLLGIVRAGGRTIARQRVMLEARIAESAELRRRAVDASARATEQAERRLHQVSIDLHDGPAQYVALAAMRLDAAVPETEAGRAEAAHLRGALQTALAEIRAISRGLSLPELETLSLVEVARRAVQAHPRPSGKAVAFDHTGPEGAPAALAQRLCLYRFLQEALSNATRHAPDAAVRVRIEVVPGGIVATVEDDGPGFDPATAGAVRADGGQGLAGIRDRAVSIGGEVRIETARGAGTRLVLTLPLGRGETE